MSGTTKLALALALGLVGSLFVPLGGSTGQAGERRYGYRVLAPISRGNLTVFPVVADFSHDTRNFQTLDEGLRSGEVVVTEAGRIQPLVRGPRRGIPQGGAEVNRLVLVNNSNRPLILLAGEIVTGGKQDRVIGKDRIVPAQSDPIDLSVFCVEPGRWVEKASTFGSFGVQMAQPSVRASAMVNRDQQKVWSEVHVAAGAMGQSVGGPAAAPGIDSTSSYAGVMSNKAVAQKVESVAAPIARSYEGLLKELRSRNAVGVVVAVDGQIIWADLFASTSLLEKYWPKLIRSYAAEAITRGGISSYPDVRAAQAFLDDLEGRRETVESEPGVYRRTEVAGDGFTAFQLTALLPGTGFDIHLAKTTQQ